VPPKDVDALAAAILRLVGDTGLQARLGKAGRERAVENYSIDKYVSRLDQMYRQYSGIEVGIQQIESSPSLHN
jgi:glycosyltransferase involved in cell wall biosynthesis